MKDNFIHVCFIIDESGSMYNCIDDVVGGFAKVIDEQKSVKEGSCSISLYKFNNKVTEIYTGKDIYSVDYLKKPDVGTNFWVTNNANINDNSIFAPYGSTAMYDGIGTAIDNIGKWLYEMPEEERPSKNLIVIMTDGGENASTLYKSQQVKDKIKEQEEKYNWTFVYMGMDITTTKYADTLGFSNQVYTTKSDTIDNYNMINSVTSLFRTSDASMAFCTMDSCLSSSITKSNNKYKCKTGFDASISKVLKNK